MSEKGRDQLFEKYCSCVFKLKAKNNKYNPYAVCSHSVYQTKGKKGPGKVRCQFEKKVLTNFRVETLRGWVVFEGLMTFEEAKNMNKKDLVAFIHQYLSSKKKVAPSEK